MLTKTSKLTCPSKISLTPSANCLPDTLREVKQRIERQLQEPDRSQEPLDDLHEDDLWGLEGSRESADDAEAPASMEEVLRITSKFKGSMAKIVSEKRLE